ncbi:protein kinase [Streptomyces sp. NPDC002701]|uniref:serine/threonine-protein kinase n=1 Tax=Streptomyces sp. NPDC002701 TaxID=3364661 RepID=UPI00367FAB3B
MGRVWRAADETLDRQVAVKEMRIDGMDQEDARTRRERTLREARATARIDHPNVVRVYDVVDEGERLWIVMELVDGRSLERVVAEDGPLSPRDTARIGLELAAALGQVHAGGVLHRDIKPGNVLVERRAGRVVLTDFGIAAIQNTEALTMAGMLVGSPDYMAPERISGRPQGPPSDLWSLGATLCAALGGRSPFSRATTLATLHAVLYEEPEIPAAAGELREALTALLRKDPAERPGLRELVPLLVPTADGSGGTAAPAVAVMGEEGPPEWGREPEPETGPPDPATEPEPQPDQGPQSDQAAQPTPEAEPEPESEPHPTPVFLRIPLPFAEPVQDAVPAEAAPSAVPAPSAEPEPAPTPPDAGNTSSEAPHEGTPEIPSEGATPDHPLRAPGVRLERPQPPETPEPQETPVSQEAPAPDGPHRTGNRTLGRKGLVIAVGVIVVAALAGLLVPLLGGSPGGGDKPSASSATPGGSDPTGPPPTVGGTARPEGSRTEAGLYAWVPPEGFDRVAQSGAQVHYSSPDRKQEVLANASTARGDLMEQWERTEESTSKGLDYRRIRLEETTFRGMPAVVWEYTVTAKGLPWHARLLGFDTGGRSYEITTWYHPDIEDRALPVYDRLKSTFTPL